MRAAWSVLLNKVVFGFFSMSSSIGDEELFIELVTRKQYRLAEFTLLFFTSNCCLHVRNFSESHIGQKKCFIKNFTKFWAFLFLKTVPESVQPNLDIPYIANKIRKKSITVFVITSSKKPLPANIFWFLSLLKPGNTFMNIVQLEMAPRKMMQGPSFALIMGSFSPKPF